jgi:hypothetical protein
MSQENVTRARTRTLATQSNTEPPPGELVKFRLGDRRRAGRPAPIEIAARSRQLVLVFVLV